MSGFQSHLWNFYAVEALIIITAKSLLGNGLILIKTITSLPAGTSTTVGDHEKTLGRGI